MTNADAAAEYAAFAMDRLLGLCRDRFADPARGGFHEELDETGRPVPSARKRVMVQCRQLYVLSHAALLGDRSGEAAAEAGYEFLRRRYHDPDHGGWRFSVSPDGAPMDGTKDLYAHAFVLFALAYLQRAFDAPGADTLAEETMDVLRARLAAPGGGFWDAADAAWTPDTAVRRQNPHMHLLEGVLAQFEATGDGAWLSEADTLVALFREHFFDAETATLGEYFTPGWAPDPERGHIVEPGHHFEWVWLLHRYAALSGRAAPTQAAEAMFGKAMAHGFHPRDGGIHDQIDRAGAPVLATRRIWPVTEAIKAHVARIEAKEPIAAEQPAALIEHLFRGWLRPARLGWIETQAEDGAPVRRSMPGSTPYHLFLAAAEARRVLG